MRAFLNRVTFGKLAFALLSITLALTSYAGSKTDYLEDALIGHLFRGTPYTAPTILYVGLMTTACSDAASGTEVSGGSYVRVGVANNSAQWNATSGGNGTTANTNPITFATPSADWGQVSHFGIWDASTAGNQLICNALTTPKTINNGDPAPSFSANALTYQEDD